MIETLLNGYSSECSAIAFQWILTWQGLDGYQEYLHPCALDESSLSIGRVNWELTPISCKIFCARSWPRLTSLDDEGNCRKSVTVTGYKIKEVKNMILFIYDRNFVINAYSISLACHKAASWFWRFFEIRKERMGFYIALNSLCHIATRWKPATGRKFPFFRK